MINLITPLTQIDSSAQFTLRSKTSTANGNEYIYLQSGDASGTYYLVKYNSNGTTTISSGSVVGSVAVAQAPVPAGSYGWYQIVGTGTVYAFASVAANKPMYVSTGSGSVDDFVQSSELIAGMFSGMAVSSGSAIVCVMNYPFCSGTMV